MSPILPMADSIWTHFYQWLILYEPIFTNGWFYMNPFLPMAEFAIIFNISQDNDSNIIFIKTMNEPVSGYI